MDKATATHTNRYISHPPRIAVYINDMGAIAIIFIPVSNLRDLIIEDNINNTFRKQYVPLLCLNTLSVESYGHKVTKSVYILSK